MQGSTVLSARLMEPNRLEIERKSNQRLVIIPNKSIHGLVALLEGRADIAMISSELEHEVELVRKSRPELPVVQLKGFEVARTRVAFAVHPSNPVKTLPIERIRAVLLGRVASWLELGGSEQPITVVTVQPGGGVPTTVRSALLDGQAFSPNKTIEVEASHHVVKIVAQEPGALGIAQLGLLDTARVVELATDTVIQQRLHLVTLGEPTDAQLAVIEAVKAVAMARMF